MSAYNKWGHVNKVVRFFDLSEHDKFIFSQGLEKCQTDKQKIQRVIGNSLDDMLSINSAGENSPLFWCFNNWGEPAILAKYLSSSTPLYAMHSSHGFTELWREKTRFHEALVTRYLKTLIKNNLVQNKMVIVGNCQGAPFAESLAIRINKDFGFWPLLISLDYIPQKNYQGQQVLLYGSASHFNPFLTDIDPIPIWQNHLGDFAWAFLDAGHGSYFKNPTVVNLVELVEAALMHYQSNYQFGAINFGELIKKKP